MVCNGATKRPSEKGLLDRSCVADQIVSFPDGGSLGYAPILDLLAIETF